MNKMIQKITKENLKNKEPTYILRILFSVLSKSRFHVNRYLRVPYSNCDLISKYLIILISYYARKYLGTYLCYFITIGELSNWVYKNISK